MAEPEFFSVDDVMGEVGGVGSAGSDDSGVSQAQQGDDKTRTISDTSDDKSESQESEKVEIEVEGKTTKVESEDSTVKALEAQIRELTNEVLKLSAVRKEPIPEPVKPPGEEKLTRAQLVQIMKEHADNPEVMLNIMDYLADQKTKEVRDETVKDLNFKQWSSQMSGTANRILSEDSDGYLRANPQVKAQLAEAATNLGLGDHPVGQLAAYAIMRLGEFTKSQSRTESNIESKGPAPEQSNKGKMDKSRTLTSSKTKLGLTSEQSAMAKKLGVKPETYAFFVKKGA